MAGDAVSPADRCGSPDRTRRPFLREVHCTGAICEGGAGGYGARAVWSRAGRGRIGRGICLGFIDARAIRREASEIGGCFESVGG